MGVVWAENSDFDKNIGENRKGKLIQMKFMHL